MSLKESSWVPNLGVKGWGVTACCIGFYIFYNFFNNASNTLFGVLTEMYGWQTTDMSFAVTVGGWASLLGIVAFGALGRKIGARNVSIVGLLLNVVAFIVLAFATTFPMFAFGVVMFFVTMVAYAVIGLGMLGSSWFPHKKGIFMGMATMGMTICGAAINPIILACAGCPIGISALFWGCAALCAILAVCMLFVKNNPEEAGAYPDNDRSVSREQIEAEFVAAQEYKKNSPWTLSKVLRTPQTWLIGFGWGLAMMAASGTMALLVPSLISFGHDQLFVVGLLASMWPAGLLGHYLIGVIDQKIGTKKTTIVVILLQMLASLLVLAAGANPVVCAASVALLMFAISGNANVCMSMTTTVFGRQDFDTAWSPIQVVYNILNFAGVSVMAIVMTNFGPQAIMVAGPALCVIALILVFACSDKQIASKVAEA